MSDSFDPTPRDPLERELAERLTRGDDAATQASDPDELKAAAAWLEELDALLLRTEQRIDAAAEEIEPDPDAVRAAVVARLTHRAPPASRVRRAQRPVAPALPWWRTAAPVAVAASLAGLFLWQTMRGEDPMPPTSPLPPTTELVAPGSARSAAERAPSATDLDEHGSFGKVEERRAELGQDLTDAPALGRRMAASLDPESVAESLLVALERGTLDERAGATAREQLIVMRPSIADSALATRIDEFLEAPPTPRR